MCIRDRTASARWWPVALSHELGKQPLACQLHDLPLVLFRAEDGTPAALPDLSLIHI